MQHRFAFFHTAIPHAGRYRLLIADFEDLVCICNSKMDAIAIAPSDDGNIRDPIISPNAFDTNLAAGLTKIHPSDIEAMHDKYFDDVCQDLEVQLLWASQQGT